MAAKTMDASSKKDWDAFEKVFGPLETTVDWDNNFIAQDDLAEEESKDFNKKGPEFESRFALPRRWDGNDIYADLSWLYDKYNAKVKKVFGESDTINAAVEEVCNKILDMLRTYLHGYPAHAYEKMCSLMSLLENEPLYADRNDIGNLYRMSKVSENINDKARIFHAPYNIRPKIKPYRYSIAGYPSLYLAESLELAEEEMHLFQKKEPAIAARFILSPTFKQQQLIKIIDFGIRPQDLAGRLDATANSVHGHSSKALQENKYRTKLERAVVYSDNQATAYQNRTTSSEEDTSKQKTAHKTNAPRRYMLWYPLIAACSYVRTNREDPFAPEYIVPQLMTQWMRSENTGVLVGIRYFSCYSRTASKKGRNYVFPTSGDQLITADGLRQYCPVLNEAFLFTETEYTAEYIGPASLEPVLNSKYPIRLFPLSRDEFREKTEVIIPEQTMYIGTRAFSDCDRLERIEIPISVLGIGELAFSGCRSLKTVKLPDRLTALGDGAFDSCTKLECIDIPEDVVSIGSGVFNNCEGLKRIDVSPNNKKYYSDNGCLIEKGDLGTSTVIATLPGTIGIPNYVTYIGNYAFAGVKNLSHTLLPDGLLCIGSSAFEDCSILALTQLPQGLTNIGSSAFKNCKSLLLSQLPEGLSIISDFAFAGCSDLSLSQLPEKIRSIGSGAFLGCTRLALTKLPSGIASVGSSAFQDCNCLALTHLPEGLTSIGSSAFQDCKRLALKKLPEGITIINPMAFDGCTSLALTQLPEGITNIGSMAFRGCIGIALKQLPDSLLNIGPSAFRGCTGLTLTQLPKGLTGIGWSAFRDCTGFTSLKMPASLKRLGSWVFSGCSNLSELIYEGTRGDWDKVEKDTGWDDDTTNFILKFSDGTSISRDDLREEQAALTQQQSSFGAPTA